MKRILRFFQNLFRKEAKKLKELTNNNMWDLDKIQEHITNGIEENLHLDYKGADSLDKTDGKKKEISKDVSAFANSGGGVIIYGVREFDEKEKSHLPEKIDPVNRVNYTKEWLEQIINSNISPKIKGVKIIPIQIGVAADNTSIYVVEIPQSDTAHQAKDKKYYKRYNFESVAMDDYEIKDIINRSNKTDIRISFEPDPGKEWYTKFLQNKYPFKIRNRIWAHNKGNQVTRFLEVFISGSEEVANYIITPYTENGKKFQLIYSNGEERKITVNDDDFVIGTERIPILPSTSRMIGELEFYSDIIQNDMEIEVLICTEDGSRTVTFKGKEIIEKK